MYYNINIIKERLGKMERCIKCEKCMFFIVKEFNTKELMLSIHEQRKILNTKQKYFWEYIPETILCETGNWEYFIKQKYVNWKTLSQIDISVLSENTLSDLIDLIKKYI